MQIQKMRLDLGLTYKQFDYDYANSVYFEVVANR